MGDYSGDNLVGHGVPELVLELNGQSWTLDASRTYTVGRDPQGDVALDDARVSWRHATIRWDGNGWLVEDLGSTNGTFSGGARVQHAAVSTGSVINLGNATDGPRLSFGAAAPQQAAPQQAAPQQAVPQQTAAQQAEPAWAGAVAAGVPATPPARPGTGAGESPRRAATAGPAGAYSDRSPTQFHALAAGRVIRIGRALENELVVSDLQVSRYHSEFHAHPDGRMEIVDLGSHNGTYVNGQPVKDRHLIGPHDIVGVGHSTFRLVGDRLEEFVDNGAVSFSARRLTVNVPAGNGTKSILKDVSFGVPEKSLIGVIGPSGSGKSTLLRALTGYRPADVGEVLYDNRDLYKQFAELRQRIGLVPQDDILHKELSVRRALKYAARLRFPDDTHAAERQARIDEVLRELKLDIHADKRITSLSGGQRKRVSVALELLTKPSLIFLDEPTSGLDPGMDRDVMQLLRALADDGRTVLVVTHSVAELALCDRLLVMAPGGSMAYFGPPDEALNFFGYSTWADVFQAFENYREYDWDGRWRGSQHYQMYSAHLDEAAPQPQPVPAMPQQVTRPAKSQSWGSQLWTLISRYVSVIASDRGFMALMLIMPAVLGLVSVVIPADYGLGIGPRSHNFTNRDAGTIMMILTVGACFSGSANSVRELIKERVIYERERAVGLSRSAYLMSKIIVLGLITALQGVIICGIGFSTRALPESGLILSGHPAIEMAIGVVGIGFTSMMFGLVISALVKTAEKTMPLLVMFAIVQVVFTGVLFQIFDKPGVEEVAWLMPSRWAVAAMGATADLNTLLPWDPGNPDTLWKHSAGIWWADIIVLFSLGIACGFLVQRLLRRHEPEVMREK